jgi:hypothetical protein
MTQPQDAGEDPQAAPAPPTLRLDEAGLARAIALSESRPMPPAEVPGYRIEQCLGVGAYGSVWLAVEQNTGKRVAVKFYSHRGGLDWSLLNREVEKLAALYTSRDVIGLIQVGWNADPPYYVMEYMQNGSLAQLLEQGPLPLAEAVRIATAVTKALMHAHRHGILHCDLKPANVLLDDDFAPRLADFGQSRLSHEQSPALGTLFYMAPEQADLDAVPDSRWDVYALGALLYHAVCGEPPFRTPEMERRLAAATSLAGRLAAYREIVAASPRPNKHRQLSSIDARLVEIIEHCLAVDPAERFASAAAVAEALEARDRFRSLRPAIGLGIVLPGLILLALFPLALFAVSNAVRISEQNVATRALESDALTAKILAYSLDDDLVQRRRTLETLAGDPDLLALIPAAAEPADSPRRQALSAWLKEAKREIDKIRTEQHADLDDSWFLTDAHGIQRWREPESSLTIDRNFGWRDYFHGLGDDRPEWKLRTDIAPVREPHISAPFRSTASGKLKVAITVPIWDENQREVLGVLGRTIHLGEVLSTYKRLLMDEAAEQQVQRAIALVDVRTGKVLDHPWMTPANNDRLKDDKVFEKLSLEKEERTAMLNVQALVRAGQEVRGANLDTNYVDPIRRIDADAARQFGIRWLAAFWPVGDSGWFAVVQEPRDDALRPVRAVQAGLVKYALTGLFLCLILTATSWHFLRRVMRARTFRLGQPSVTK